jgi:hypothetical protein
LLCLCDEGVKQREDILVSPISGETLPETVPECKEMPNIDLKDPETVAKIISDIVYDRRPVEVYDACFKKIREDEVFRYDHVGFDF